MSDIREALRPFAEMAPAIARLLKPGGLDHYDESDRIPVYVRQGHVSRAAQLLEKSGD